MAEATKTIIHLDELREYALRDASKLEPGTEVIFVHVPTLGNPERDDCKQWTSAYFATVVEVKEATFAELHPRVTNPVETEAKPVILYQHGKGSEIEGIEGYRHTTDAGVDPYDSETGYYGEVNFTVLLSELEERGLTPVFEVTEEYAQALVEHNEKVVIFPSYDIYYDYYSDSYSDGSINSEDFDALAPAPVHLDELRGFAIHDPSEFVPGHELIIAMVPQFSETTVASRSSDRPVASRVKLKEVIRATMSSLNDRDDRPFEKPQDLLVILAEDGSESYRPLDAVGVLPYASGYRSTTTFVVSATELEDQGLEPLLTTSESYENLRSAAIERRDELERIRKAAQKSAAEAKSTPETTEN